MPAFSRQMAGPRNRQSADEATAAWVTIAAASAHHGNKKAWPTVAGQARLKE
jgi:hypothetical protein